MSLLRLNCWSNYFGNFWKQLGYFLFQRLVAQNEMANDIIAHDNFIN